MALQRAVTTGLVKAGDRMRDDGSRSHALRCNPKDDFILMDIGNVSRASRIFFVGSEACGPQEVLARNLKPRGRRRRRPA